MRIVFLGTGDFGVPVLRALREAGHEVVTAISQPDRPAGRGRVVRPTPVHAAADKLGVPHVQAEDVNALMPAETAGGAELGVVVAFGQKIGATWLEGLPRGCINLHGSLLPAYRGAAPYQWAIINGDETTGVTIFQLNERWDAGAIWAKRATPIRDEETADELHDRLAVIGAALMVETVAAIVQGAAEPEVQDAARATRAPKLSKADSAIDWSQPARVIVRRIHGLWSWPAATCRFVSHRGKEERLLLARAAVVNDGSGPSEEFPAGVFRADGTVQAGQGAVRLHEVKPAGGKKMPFDAFAHGRQVAPGDRLQPVDAP
jgi:methionyl-tRNA formyltransferase